MPFLIALKKKCIYAGVKPLVKTDNETLAVN